MSEDKGGNPEDAELDRALGELLAQTRKEPISPRLRELADDLARALEAAQLRRLERGDGNG